MSEIQILRWVVAYTNERAGRDLLPHALQLANWIHKKELDPQHNLYPLVDEFRRELSGAETATP